MYAVIETGSKQYLVEKGTVLRIEKLELEKGSDVQFEKVLMVGGNGKPSIGAPVVSGATVKATVVKSGLCRKVLVYHKKRRKGYEKLSGHRQPYTEIKVTDIQA